MVKQFDPYRKWLGIPEQLQPPHHYHLLGIAEFEDDPDVIENAANRQMIHVRSFQSGTYAKESQDLLNKLAQAKVCLLQTDSKTAYDANLKAKLTPVSAPPVSTVSTTAHPGMAPMNLVTGAVTGEIATPVKRTPSTETAIPVRAANPMSSLPGQARTGSNPISRRARKRSSNAAVPWLLAVGALAGVAALIAILMFILQATQGTPK